MHIRPFDKGVGRMKRAPSSFSRSTRIEEEAEHDYNDTSSSDYEEHLLAVPQPALKAQASSNLFDAELAGPTQAATSPDAAGSEGEDAEDEEGLLDDDVMAGAGADREEAIRERIAQAQEQMKLLLEMFDEDQLRRYEAFRRSWSRPVRPAIERLMVRVLEHRVNANSVIVVAGIAKVFVGELIEEARKIADDLGDRGPIQPSHLLEAHRRLKLSGLASTSSMYKRPKNRLI